VANVDTERDDFTLYVSKSVPQRLKPSIGRPIHGTAEPVPFVKSFFPIWLRISPTLKEGKDVGYAALEKATRFLLSLSSAAVKHGLPKTNCKLDSFTRALRLTVSQHSLEIYFGLKMF
jgi:hypothetical protein